MTTESRAPAWDRLGRRAFDLIQQLEAAGSLDERFQFQGGSLWPLYDCATNAWLGMELKGADPIGKKAFNNSMGLMYDPNRRLVWAVGQYSHVRADETDLNIRFLSLQNTGAFDIVRERWRAGMHDDQLVIAGDVQNVIN